MKLTHVLSLTILAATLTACGGGGSDEPDPCEEAGKGNLPLLNGLACFGEAFGNKPGSSGTSATHSTANDISEYEPNTSLGNANLVDIGNGQRIHGVLGENDPSDNFIFTPATIGTYRVYLCSEDCDTALDTGSQSLMILDQTQSTIAATPVAVSTPQSLTVPLQAGFAYYLRINGEGSGQYSMVIEANSAQ